MFSFCKVWKIRTLTFALFLSVSAQLVFSQEANYWFFGDSVGLRFSGGPALQTCGSMWGFEGCTTYSDPTTGRLLFFSNGGTVWDASYHVMQNGSGLLAQNNDDVQGAVVVPQPGSNHIYYLFTKENWNGAFGYSVIDINANSGLGAVTIKNVILDQDGLAESMAVTRHANGIDHWVVLHGTDASNSGIMDTTWSAYLVTAAGVDTVPVTTKDGLGIGYGSSCGACNVSQFDFSQDGKYLSYPGLQSVLHFDNATGMVTGLAGWIDYGYGTAFSPDGSKVYIAGGDGIGKAILVQYDMLAGAGNPDSIYNSAVILFSGSSPAYDGGSLQLGPDGKIYHALANDYYLGAINTPNAKGVACNYVNHAIYLGGHKSRFALPNFAKPITLFSDSLQNIPSFLGQDTAICQGIVMLYAQYPNASSYQWSTGETSQSIQVSTSGIYSVSINYGTCAYTDSVNVSIGEGPIADAGTDTTILAGSEATLHGSGGNSCTWSPSTGLSSSTTCDPIASPGETTTYYLAVTDAKGCTGMDSVTVFVTDSAGKINCGELFIASAFSPNGDGINDLLLVRSNCIRHMSFVILDRWGEKVFQTDNIAEGWDGSTALTTSGIGPDIFAYELNAEMNNGDKVYRKGNVALIK